MMNGKAAVRGYRRHGAHPLRRPWGAMGIRLVSEVLDHYHGPDVRKLWLLAWAEKANDGTRAGWPTREVLARRTGKSPSRVSHIAEELVSEGVLKRDGGGHRGGPARFIMLPLAAAGKGAVWAHPFTDAGAGAEPAVKGAHCAHPSNSGADGAEPDEMGAPRPHPSAPVKGAALTHPNERRKGAPRPHPKPGVKGAESPIKGAESGVKGADPNPQPAETVSLPLIPSIEQPSENLAVADAPTAQTILAGFIDWVRSNDGDLTKRTIGHLARQVGDLLAQGTDDRHVRRGLADWFLAGQHSATLDSFVNAAINAEARKRAEQETRRQPGAAVPESTGTARARQAMEAGRRVQAMLDERNQT